MVSSGPRASLWARARFLLEVAKAGMRGYDVVIANHVALAPVAAMMKLIWGTPYWVACHCVEVWWGTSRWRHVALKNADLVLPVSQYTASVVQKMEGIENSRVKVIYNAIPNGFVDLLTEDSAAVGVGGTRESGGRVLLSVCSFAAGNEFKGVDTVIRALPGILSAMPDLRYVVVGEGVVRKKLEALAAEIGVAKSVTFAGEVTDDELAGFYRECDVFVLPSRGKGLQGVAGGEGFGRVYIEAALAGKPVVGSRAGGAAEAVLHGRTGFVVNPESSEEVTEALLTILRDRELAARMGAAGRAWALEMFSEDALADSLRKLLRPYGLVSEGLQILQAGGPL
jgi:glycosyltransferase involved in cell wall biosynthesis